MFHLLRLQWERKRGEERERGRGGERERKKREGERGGEREKNRRKDWERGRGQGTELEEIDIFYRSILPSSSAKLQTICRERREGEERREGDR